MSEGGQGPKLYTNKPRKEQLKQAREQQKAKAFSSPMSSSSAMGTQQQQQPPPPKESFARRYKFVWPMLLAVNLAIGAYLFMRTKKKDIPVEEEQYSTPVSTKDTTTNPAAQTPVASLPMTEQVIRREPIPEHQQRELFKWILEEKRKVKPKDPEEKRKLDEEKAVLKQFIRAKSIPSI